MTEPAIDPALVEDVRYICRIIDDGHFSLDLKWTSVVDALSYSLDIEHGKVQEILGKANVGYQGELEAEFLAAGVFDAEIDKGEKKRIFTQLLSHVESNPTLSNILMLISTEYNFTLALLEFLFSVKGRHLDRFKDDPLLPIITSDLFIESGPSNSFVKGLLKDVKVDFGRIRELVRNDWFMDLLTILKSGAAVNESRGFLKLIEREAHTINTEEIISLISDGTLETVVLHRNSVLKQNFVTIAFLKRYEAEQHEKKLRRFYYWLGIANDLVLGVLFLVGSIEFIPGMPTGSLLIGVVMFIIGSAQLVARSLIQIAMNIHIRSSRKRKMQEIPS